MTTRNSNSTCGKAEERAELLAAFILTAALVLAHFYLLQNRGPLWRDEISSLKLATQPTWRAFWSGLAFDPFPAAFFVLLRSWQSLFGPTDFALRMLGVVIGVAGLGSLWIQARLMGRKTPLLSLVLLGLCPTYMIWGDSLRAYGLGMIWVALAFGAFWRVLEQATPLRVIVAALTAILAVQTIYTSALLILACGGSAALLALVRHEGRKAAIILAIGAAAAVSLLPYLGLFGKLKEWASLARVDLSFEQSFTMLGHALLGPHRPLFWLWVALFLIALVGATIRLFRKGIRDDRLAYVCISALIAFAGTMIFFRAVGWGTNVWYYLPLLVIVAGAIDTILDQPRSNSFVWRLGRPAFAVLSVALFAPTLTLCLETRASNIDVVARFLSRHAGQKDFVVVWPASDGVTFQYYLPRQLDWTTIPPVAHLPVQPGDDVMAPFREADLMQPILAKIDTTLAHGGKVWVASTLPLMNHPSGKAPAVLPFNPAAPRTLGYFLRGWSCQLVDHLQRHATTFEPLEIPIDQIVSPYEESQITVFAGYNPEGATARR